MNTELEILLDPYARWDKETDSEGNTKAYEILKVFLDKLRKTKPDKKYLSGRGNMHSSYYITLYAIRKALVSKYYMRACHELITLFHFEKYLQGRIRCNVIKLLEQHLEG